MKKADIWALGITLFCMTFNRLPFKIGDTEIEMMKNVAESDITFEGRHISKELKQLLSAMLHKDWEKRGSAEELM